MAATVAAPATKPVAATAAACLTTGGAAARTGSSSAAGAEATPTGTPSTTSKPSSEGMASMRGDCNPRRRRLTRCSEVAPVDAVALDPAAAHRLHAAVHGGVRLPDPPHLAPRLRGGRGHVEVLDVEGRRDAG